MEVSGTGKPNTSLSFRYKANNEQLEELFDIVNNEPPPTPPFDSSTNIKSETESPKKAERTPSLIDKYFKSMRTEKDKEKSDEKDKAVESKNGDEIKPPIQSSPMKDYLKNLGKRNVSEPAEGPNETWKIFHDFKFKITQAVEDMKTRSGEETKEKEKSVQRDNSEDSEENSAIKDSDQSVGDTDNQVSSLESSIQNLSEMTQPVTANATEREVSLPSDKNYSDSSDDTHKNLYHSDLRELEQSKLTEAQMEVESGVEALEDGIDGLDEATHGSEKISPTAPHDPPCTPQPSPLKSAFRLPPSNTNIYKPPKDTQIPPKTYFFNFTLYLVTFLLIANYLLFPDWHILNGFLLGIWFYCFAGNLKVWVLDNYFSDRPMDSSRTFLRMRKSSAAPLTYTIPSVKEHRPVKKFEGWINHYRFPHYDPITYHLNKTTTAFMKLEGSNLRISYTKTKVPKRALWDEKIEKVEFYQHRLYNLTGARVMILPTGLVKRRIWSKKYPICIVLSEKEKIQVLEKESVTAERRHSEAVALDRDMRDMYRRRDTFEADKESTETNTSPEKKKKFVWRRRDRSAHNAGNDSGKESTKEPTSKEGLRHRLVRKMHRDKKTDSVSTFTEPDNQAQADKNMQFEDLDFHDAEMEPTKSATSTNKDDATEEELDDTEMSRIKEFLEEAESETGAENTETEGEWSVHVKHKVRHAKLFFFTRTGRDKHEWFRRITMSIQEANASLNPEPAATEEKSNSEPSASENKDGIEMAVYKIHAPEKEGVTFNVKPSTKESKESKETSERVTTTNSSAPSTFKNLENLFWPYLIKIMESKTATPPPCECRMLPSEVSWLNTIFARMLFDVMNNKVITALIKTRVQKKLNTIKIPSFMSPLIVQDLSLTGACPLIERVSSPSWDERGVWLDADIRYEGGAYITVLTQINLMKLKEKNMSLEDQLMGSTHDEDESNSRFTHSDILHSEHSARPHSSPPLRKAACFDSEVEDSAESSEDDETPPVQPIDSSENIVSDHSMQSTSDTTNKTSKLKFLRMVDKIATNKYFQQVTDYKYVKRAMEGLSNTDIKVQLEVQGLEGRMVLNLPPPPHDRIWMGFRSNPQLVLKARPAVGARTLRFAHISNWIEQKLNKEFEKALVYPNMEDFIVGVMNPTPTDCE